MKRTLTILLAAAALFLAPACDSKRDINGPFDGMWQMTSWEDLATGTQLADNTTGLYYCVQLQLIKFVRKDYVIKYHLALFTRTPDSLILGKIVHYPTDTVCRPDVLQSFGVPADGRFKIDHLTSERMVLSTPQARLTFRKY